MFTLIIDGVRYKLWTPKDEENEFHPLTRKCFKDIFGGDSLYFDVRHILKAASGVGSIPDAYVISLSRSELYVLKKPQKLRKKKKKECGCQNAIEAGMICSHGLAITLKN